MKKNVYNSNDSEYQHVIRLLKELPKEKASDNFEYNLGVKIKNKNFGLNTKEPRVLFPWKIFMPATGVAAAALLLFFTFFSESETFENPFQLQPKLRTELSASLQKNTQNTLDNNNFISENDVIFKNKIDSDKTNKSPSKSKSIIASNENEKPNFPFNNSTNLDEAITGNAEGKISNKASLAGRSNLQSSFNGFFIRNEVDKAYVEALKARMDSLKKEYRNNHRNGNITE